MQNTRLNKLYIPFLLAGAALMLISVFYRPTGTGSVQREERNYKTVRDFGLADKVFPSSEQTGESSSALSAIDTPSDVKRVSFGVSVAGNNTGYSVERESSYDKNGENVTEKVVRNGGMRISSWLYRTTDRCVLDVDIFEYADEGYVLSARRESFFDYGCDGITNFSWNPGRPDIGKRDAYLKWLKLFGTGTH